MNSFEQDLAAAIAEHQRGDLARAIAGYRKLLEAQPENAAVLANLATAFKQAGRADDALRCFQRALETGGSIPAVWFNYANLLQKTGRLDEAEQAYRRAIALDASMHPALTNLANLLALRRRADEAIELHREALRIAPENVASLRALARLLYQREDFAEAARLYRGALSLDPSHADTHNSLGVVLKNLGQNADAIACWRRALELAPRHAGAHNNLGAMFRLMSDLPRAVSHLREAVRLDPDDPTSAANLAHALLNLGQITEARELSRRAVEKHPRHPDGHLMLGFALVQQARIEEAIGAFRKTHEEGGESSAVLSNALFAGLYSDRRDAAGILALHRELAGRIVPGGPVRTHWQNSRDPRRRLKVGFVSSDLRSHPVAYFFEPVLAHLSRDVLETFCYSATAAPDAITTRLREKSAAWRDCSGWHDERLAAQIESDGIDILVDLAGHTAQNRAPVFRQKPAPVQALYIGYPCTTGLPEMDYLIADERVCPAASERFYSERIARVAGSFWCYQPRAHSPETGPLPARANGFITFGSFNTLPKISETTIALWSRVLEAVPRSRLRLKALSFADEATRDLFCEHFEKAGIARERLEILPPTMEHRDFLPEYHRVDIALDPVPYNGGTTTCEALWMGVPVVTLPGEHFFARMTFSFLHHLDLSDLAASTADEYVRIAAGLATDLPRLETLRHSLRACMAASPICDAPRAARELQEAFRSMWQDTVTR